MISSSTVGSSFRLVDILGGRREVRGGERGKNIVEGSVVGEYRYTGSMRGREAG